MPCGLSERGGASLNLMSLNAKLSFALQLEATPVGGVLDNVLRALHSGRVPTGHPATKPKLLKE